MGSNMAYADLQLCERRTWVQRVLGGAVVLLWLLNVGSVGWSHEAKAPYQEAVRAYSQNRDAEALEAVKRALSIYPNYAEAHFLMGLISMRQNRTAEATAAIQKAVSIYPNFAEAHYQLAVLLQQQKKLKPAEAELLKAVEIFPNYTEASLLLAGIYEQQKEPDKALTAYR
jgi:tetratricopeptide (TPR) repeat protein